MELEVKVFNLTNSPHLTSTQFLSDCVFSFGNVLGCCDARTKIYGRGNLKILPFAPFPIISLAIRESQSATPSNHVRIQRLQAQTKNYVPSCSWKTKKTLFQTWEVYKCLESREIFAQNEWLLSNNLYLISRSIVKVLQVPNKTEPSATLSVLGDMPSPFALI